MDGQTRVSMVNISQGLVLCFTFSLVPIIFHAELLAPVFGKHSVSDQETIPSALSRLIRWLTLTFGALARVDLRHHILLGSVDGAQTRFPHPPFVMFSCLNMLVPPQAYRIR